MKAIIIDDEITGAEVLKLLIEKNSPDVQILAVEHSVKAAIESITELKPDLIFLDIEMPLSSGFDVVNATTDMDYEIIFTTAYEHYAIKAIKTQAIDYLLKPIDKHELLSALDKARKKVAAKKSQSVPKIMEGASKQTLPRNRKIPFSTNEGVFLVAPEEIVHLEANSNYTNIFLKDGRKIFIARTLKNIEEQLESDDFCRVHHGHIININEIDRYIRGDGGSVLLKNKTMVPVSRTHKQGLVNKLGI